MDRIRKNMWTEQDLLNLRGVPESARLEFKRSQLLTQPKQKIAETLSCAVSAFANSEGGLIVIGMTDRRDGKSRVADDLDEGVKASAFPIESFQQLIEGNVSPYLPGMRFFKVTLGGPRTGRIAIVVEVPSGSTAYQASDKRYYARSEYEAVPLPDHEIRMRMMRGRVPQVSLEVEESALLTAEDEYAARMRQLDNPKGDELIFMPPEIRETLSAPKRVFDEYSMSFLVVNSGEVTIRDFMLAMMFHAIFVVEVTTGESMHSLAKARRWRFAEGQQTVRGMTREVSRPERVIFPFDRIRFPEPKSIIRVPAGQAIQEGDLVLHWTIYLDGTSPCSGEIDIRSTLRHGS